MLRLKYLPTAFCLRKRRGSFCHIVNMLQQVWVKLCRFAFRPKLLNNYNSLISIEIFFGWILFSGNRVFNKVQHTGKTSVCVLQ